MRSLETRQFTNAEVASRVRLTKTPEDYAATRATRKEAAYEALYRLGRTWRAGERVMLYTRLGWDSCRWIPTRRAGITT